MTTTNTAPGLWRNLLAMVYDTFLVAPLLMANSFVLVTIYGPTEDASVATVPALLMQVTGFAVIITFFALFWCKSGQTLGMQAWRIKLVNVDGSPVSVWQAIGRCIAALLSLAPAGLGYWWALVDKDSCRWHDRLTQTRLIKVAKRSAS